MSYTEPDKLDKLTGGAHTTPANNAQVITRDLSGSPMTFTQMDDNLKNIAGKINEVITQLSNLDSDLTTAKTDLQTSVDAAQRTDLQILNIVCPVGGIHITVVNSAPTVGTWVKYGEGRTLVGHSTTDSDFGSVSQDGTAGIGGAKSVTLTESQMPSHTHSLGDSTNKVWTSTSLVQEAGTKNNASYSFKQRENSIDSTGTTGGGLAHENMPPYVTVYFWRRTS